MKIIRFYFFIAILAFVNIANAQQKITVAVAANMQYAFDELKTEYQKTHNVEIDAVLGASGNLTQQIMNSAPFDIFISADTSYPQKIDAASLSAEKPKVYAQGILVVWSVKNKIKPEATLKFLLNDEIKSIAIANPVTAPYGTAAQAILKKYNLLDKVQNKIVTGESITQTSQFIETQNADVGFTAKAIVISNAMKGKGTWVELNRNDYSPILQSAVLLKDKSAEAKNFYYFLYSEQAKTILKNFGYIIP